MAGAHRGAEAVAVFATVLALAACGTDVPDDPLLTVGPSMPPTSTEGDTRASADESDPTATPPTATPAVATPPEAPSTQEGSGTHGSSATPDGTQDSPSTPGRPDTLPDFGAPSEPQTQDATGQVQLLIEQVRVGSHDGFDRVVLDLSGAGEVGWRAQYVTDPALDGSGAPVDLAGEFVLLVNLQGMAYPEPGDTAYEEGELLVDGGDLSAVTEILRTAPFEGQVPVFIGTRTEAPFRVFRLSEPERLVIDVQH